MDNKSNWEKALEIVNKEDTKLSQEEKLYLCNEIKKIMESEGGIGEKAKQLNQLYTEMSRDINIEEILK